MLFPTHGLRNLFVVVLNLLLRLQKELVDVVPVDDLEEVFDIVRSLAVMFQVVSLATGRKKKRGRGEKRKGVSFNPR